MPSISVGTPAPAFELPATGGRTVSLAALRGHNTVLYFYPKDSTPGCTREGQDFRDRFAAFKQLNTIILGVSRDSLRAHENFKTKQDFPFELLSDPEERACRAYDVMRKKNMYGREVFGIERSTFLIDAEGILRREWRKVKVAGHVEEVLAAIKELG